MSYFVRYKVTGHDKESQSGPYDSIEIALEHQHDIQGYEGVYHSFVTKVPMSKPRGFAAMDREKVREIASKGGKQAHESGTAHKWTKEEASAAGRKGGSAPHKTRGGPRKTKVTDESMSN